MAIAQSDGLTRGFLDQYCVACHNDGNATANISVTPLDPSDVSLHGDVWEKILRKVRAAEMPPPGLPKPEPEVIGAFNRNLQLALDEAALANPDPGRPAIHRLNRSEYANAVRDLLAVEIDEKEALPADDTGYGFDNIADVLSFSPILLERYMQVARRVSRLAVGSTDIVPSQTDWKVETRGTARLRVERVSNDLPFSSRGGMSVEHYFPVDAEYVIKLDVRLSRYPEPKLYELRLPMTAGRHTVGATFLASSAVEERTGAAPRRPDPWAENTDLTRTALLDVRIDGERVRLDEFELRQDPLQVAAVYVEGPYNITGPGDTESRRRIFSCTPTTTEDEASCAREILSRLARRAYRRPVSGDDVSPLMGVYEMARQDGDFEVGIQRALQAILVSPSFLFRVERDPADAAAGEAHRISDLELASRLSFFLWSSIPDEELLASAEAGRLSNPDVLRTQIKRMIANPKSDSLVQNFAGQWLFLRRMEDVKPDPDLFDSFDVPMRSAMRRETELLFGEVLREDRSVMELLDADYTYVNQQLAEHYGIPNIYGSQFRRVELDDANRRGLLGQASVLTVTSYANRTSVVQRGAWVLENLLGTPPPPPPPNVPTLEDQDHGDRKLSLREKMELHRTNVVCASCHARMDAIGFALENFDAIGRWRDSDDGEPIDASGSLPDGAEFDGPSGLRELMLTKYREEFASTALEKLMTYALGRGLEHYDQPVIRSILRDNEENEFQMSQLITSIVESTPFQMRRTLQP